MTHDEQWAALCERQGEEWQEAFRENNAAWLRHARNIALTACLAMIAMFAVGFAFGYQAARAPARQAVEASE